MLQSYKQSSRLHGERVVVKGGYFPGVKKNKNLSNR